MTPAPVRLCPRCFKSFPRDTGDLAAHLHTEHAVSAMAAIREARGHGDDFADTDTDAAKEAPNMPTHGKPGVLGGDPSVPCGWCKQPKTAHRPQCPKTTATTTGPAATGGGGRPRRPGAKQKTATAGKGKRPTLARKAPVAPRVAPTNGGDPLAAVRALMEHADSECTKWQAVRDALALVLRG